jgi:hypothetical protein
VDAGAHEFLVVPVGLAYEDKAILRSRVLLVAGRPLAVDRNRGDCGSSLPRPRGERDKGEGVTSGTEAPAFQKTRLR